jgi:hypothetical protein
MEQASAEPVGLLAFRIKSTATAGDGVTKCMMAQTSPDRTRFNLLLAKAGVDILSIGVLAITLSGSELVAWSSLNIRDLSLYIAAGVLVICISWLIMRLYLGRNPPGAISKGSLLAYALLVSSLVVLYGFVLLPHFSSYVIGDCLSCLFVNPQEFARPFWRVLPQLVRFLLWYIGPIAFGSVAITFLIYRRWMQSSLHRRSS